MFSSHLVMVDPNSLLMSLLGTELSKRDSGRGRIRLGIRHGFALSAWLIQLILWIFVDMNLRLTRVYCEHCKYKY